MAKWHLQNSGGGVACGRVPDHSNHTNHLPSVTCSYCKKLFPFYACTSCRGSGKDVSKGERGGSCEACGATGYAIKKSPSPLVNRDGY